MFLIHQVSIQAMVHAPVYRNGTLQFSSFAHISAEWQFFIKMVVFGKPLMHCMSVNVSLCL